MGNTMREALVSAGKLPTVTCQYCGKSAKLVNGLVIYPHRADLADKMFWLCKPCDAYVGCHAPSRHNKFDKAQPLGTLANKVLRQVRSLAHKTFDEIWRSGKKSRSEAYAWLASQLLIKQEDCHIAMFDYEQCRKTVKIANDYWNP